MHLRTLITFPLALAILAAAALPNASAQDEPAGHFVMSDGHAQGRFVAFGLAEGGAVCDWSFEGHAVIDAMVGVGGDARTEGRSIVLEGDAPDDGDGASCSANASAPSEPDDDEEDDPEGNATAGNGTESSSASASSASRGPAPAGGRANVKLHDTPNGAITFRLDAGDTVQIDFEDGVDVRAEGSRVRLRGDDGLRASLFVGDGDDGVDVRVDGSRVTLDADVHAKAHFRMEDGDLGEDEGDDMEEHRDDGDVACEVFVSDDDEPHVVEIDGANVSVSSTHTSVRVDLDIAIDVDVDVGSGSGSTVTTTQTQPPTATQTVTRTATQTTTETATATATSTGTRTTTGDGGDGDGGPGCGCAATVLILDVDVTVLVLDADDDLIVSVGGVRVARADSVEDALTVEAGEDPEALVVVDQEQEVKVLLSLAEGQSQVSMERQDGQEFQTREPVRTTRTTTLDGGDDGLAGVQEVTVTRGDADDDAPGGGADVGAPGFGLGAALTGVAIALAAAAVRRRL